ncbi:MAG: prenyltransferase/squalene oxidase repeat-containing protein [Verrucomicrobiota bacterium]
MTAASHQGILNPLQIAARFLEPEATSLLARYLASQWLPEGGCRGRSRAGDLYYTVFQLECWQGLGLPFPEKAVGEYLERFGTGQPLDFIHCACLSRCRALLPSTRANLAVNREILGRLEQFRCADGGYNQRLTPGDAANFNGAIYEGFLARLAYETMGVDLPRSQDFLCWTSQLKPVDGGYAGKAGLQSGTTTVTAAAIALRLRQGLPVPESAGQWLLARWVPEGGFLAAPGTPLPDLLSTATALQALALLGIPLGEHRQACLEFVESLWTGDGGFSGHAADPETDCEYTYYGLLALGLLMAEAHA